MGTEKANNTGNTHFKRVSSALIGFPLVVILLVLGNKHIINIGFSIVAMLSMYEYLHAAEKKCNPIKWISYLSCISIALIGILPKETYGEAVMFGIPIVVLVLFLQVIITGMKTNFNDLVYTLMGIIYIVFFIVSMAMISNLNNGKILIWYVLFSGWATDVFAYAVGRRFGKHKFSSVSPKKSIEGCLAGIIGAIAVNLVYTYFINIYGAVEYSYLHIVIITALLSIIGQIGDFAASSIKRYVDIKDYGDLIPGHGGMLDRIDSIMFIAPFAYMLLNFL